MIERNIFLSDEERNKVKKQIRESTAPEVGVHISLTV